MYEWVTNKMDGLCYFTKIALTALSTSETEIKVDIESSKPVADMQKYWNVRNDVVPHKP
jgi:hypothetical protein